MELCEVVHLEVLRTIAGTVLRCCLGDHLYCGKWKQGQLVAREVLNLSLYYLSGSKNAIYYLFNIESFA